MSDSAPGRTVKVTLVPTPEKFIRAGEELMQKMQRPPAPTPSPSLALRAAGAFLTLASGLLFGLWRGLAPVWTQEPGRRRNTKQTRCEWYRRDPVHGFWRRCDDRDMEHWGRLFGGNRR